ncbi:MAG TPA: hypothetical protein PK123_06900, partial [Bacteroidales bacterium]|nr:hypothetical protein [Bacteroidales bacterium]
GNTNTAYDAYRNKSGFTAFPGGSSVPEGQVPLIIIFSPWYLTALLKHQIFSNFAFVLFFA